MTQTARTARPATTRIPGQRAALAAPAAVDVPGPSAARRFLEVLLGARSLRPVTAGARQSYGECDGQ
ncbi:hypothetical protein ACIRPK_32375 [Kitasatospora sp. NPDC101801]|uniref:hypothetical protein n=1 Tax=Kitasatospora sp. NPDC101801 TaxID=3364103 RepID=UPI003830DE22